MTRSAGEALWTLAALAFAALAALPLAALLWTAAQGSEGLWSHLAQHVLPRAVRDTTVLLLGVGLVAAVVGTGCAWLVSAYTFPLRRVLGWALLLPLAVPTYIIAFAYLDLMHPLGPVQSAVRAALGYDTPREFRLPDIRTLWACIALLGLVLYPYVYLTVRAMFATQAASLVEAARTLGVGGVALFRRVALPLARPAVAVGVALVMLETLNDVGASEFLGVKTLTVAVYTTWITRSDLPGAAQLACAMLAVVALLLVLERAARRRQRFAVALRPRPLQPQPLRGARAWLATLACALPVVLGFIAPALHLAVEAWERMQGEGVSAQLVDAAWNTLRIAVFATLATLAAGLLLAFALRLVQARRGADLLARAVQAGARVGALGYAIPGTVLAIALLAPLGWFDALAARWSMPLLMGSTAALVLAYTLRFTAIPAGGLESGYARVPIALDQSARSLGAGAGRLLAQVHLPLLRPAMGAAALLVFVDAMKELPATLLLRPLGFESLSTWLYGEAARGTYEEGAVAALLIVLAGLPAVLWMHATLAPRLAATPPPERSP